MSSSERTQAAGSHRGRRADHGDNNPSPATGRIALYAFAKTAIRELSGPPGPANNSFDGITGYPATKVWNACTGLGSINGQALQDALKTTAAKSAADVMTSR